MKLVEAKKDSFLIRMNKNEIYSLFEGQRALLEKYLFQEEDCRFNQTVLFRLAHRRRIAIGMCEESKKILNGFCLRSWIFSDSEKIGEEK